MRYSPFRRFARRVVASAALPLAATWTTACAPAADRPPAAASEFAGIVMAEPLPKPAATFTDTHGAPYDLRAETKGSVTLLFFGYTHCPDICPVHMANLAAVLRDAEPRVRDHVKVVFVTTDPDRDTPAQLRKWLDAFDSTFVGLTAPIDEVNRVQALLNVPAAVRDPAAAPDDTSYSVGHGAQVIAFSPFDELAHVVYPFGTRQRDWAHDLPLLVDHKW